MDVIKMIQKAQKTHIEWAEFLEKYPDAEYYEEYKYVGSAKDHRKYIKEYDEVIVYIEQLQAENENWKARYIEAVNDMVALKRKVVKLEHALQGE